MKSSYDVIVVGLGAMGSATIYHLARRGLKVLGFDRFQPPHTSGSSHGLSRIIREAYFEHPAYVPLVQRAYGLWHELEASSDRTLLHQTGGLMIGPPDGALVAGARRSAEQHELPHEVLSPDQIRRRYPCFQPAPEMVAVSEPRAGILFPELAIQTHLELAARHGAVLHFNEATIRWESNDDQAIVRTSAAQYSGHQLVLAAGAWNSMLVSGPKLPLAVERQVLFWFEPTPGNDVSFQPEHCPIQIWEYSPGEFFYAFPDVGDGVKVAIHHQGQPADPDRLQREVQKHEVLKIRSLVQRFLPGANGALKNSAVCMYTNTPDEHFIVDFLPGRPRVLLLSPCSGHGFKFSSAIGEVASQLLTEGKSSLDLSLFQLNRFVD